MNKQGLLYHDGNDFYLGVAADGTHTSGGVIISSGDDLTGIKVSKKTNNGRQLVYLSDSTHTHNYLPLAGGTVTGTLILSNITDVDALAEKDCALKIGDINGLHLEFDGNEIIAKASPTTPNALYINGSSGGDVYLANSKFHAKADGGADVNGALSVTGTVTSTGVIKTTGGSIIANDCTSYNAGVSGGYISTGGRIVAVSGASDSYPQMMFVVNKSKTTWTQLRSTNSSGTYTVTLPAASGTLALSSSDIRLKENIKPTQVKALDVLNKINLYAYDWTPEGREDSPHWSVGMVADQIESLDKNLVSGGGYFADGTMNVKTIDTFYLCGYIVKAIQELSKDIDQLRKK